MPFRVLIFMNISYAPAHLSSLTETETLFLMLMVTNKNQLQLKEKGIGNNHATFSISCGSKQKPYLEEFKNKFFSSMDFSHQNSISLRKKKYHFSRHLLLIKAHLHFSFTGIIFS